MSGPADIEVARALNALVTTLNDQGATAVDVARWQQIVTGALGGEPLIIVRADPGAGAPAGLLEDRDGRLHASLGLRGDRWLGRREGSPLSRGYVPR